MYEPELVEHAFIDFDAFLPKPRRVLALIEAFGTLLGAIPFVLFTGIVLGRRCVRC